MPDDVEEEIGIIVGGAEWRQEELRESLNELTRGIMVRRFSDTYTSIDAGFDAANLQFLVEVGGFVGPIAATKMLDKLVSVMQRGRDQRRGERVEDLARQLTDADYERVVRDALFSRYQIPRDQLRIDSVERDAVGTGSVEISLPATNGRRFKVDVRFYKGDLTAYHMKRINPAS